MCMGSVRRNKCTRGKGNVRGGGGGGNTHTQKKQCTLGMGNELLRRNMHARGLGRCSEETVRVSRSNAQRKETYTWLG